MPDVMYKKNVPDVMYIISLDEDTKLTAQDQIFVGTFNQSGIEWDGMYCEIESSIPCNAMCECSNYTEM